MIKRLLLTTLLFTVITSCKQSTSKASVWTEAYEQNQFNQMDVGMKPRYPDDNRRRQLIYYVIKHLKEQLPAGVESIPRDSLMSLSRHIGEEYAYTQKGMHETGLVPSAVEWTPEMDRMLRKVLLEGVKPENMASGNKICDCIITKLRKIYPDKVVVPFPHDVIQKITKQCHDEMPNAVLE